MHSSGIHRPAERPQTEIPTERDLANPVAAVTLGRYLYNDLWVFPIVGASGVVRNAEGGRNASFVGGTHSWRTCGCPQCGVWPQNHGFVGVHPPLVLPVLSAMRMFAGTAFINVDDPAIFVRYLSR